MVVRLASVTVRLLLLFGEVHRYHRQGRRRRRRQRRRVEEEGVVIRTVTR